MTTSNSITTTTTIDITPLWVGVLPLLLAAYTDGNFEGRKIALEELRRMAEAADRYNAAAKKEHV